VSLGNIFRFACKYASTILSHVLNLASSPSKSLGGLHLSAPFPLEEVALAELMLMLVVVDGSTISLVISCSGTVGFLGSIGVTGLNMLAASMLNSSVILCALSVGDMPRLDKSIGGNMGVSGNCCGVLTLGVLVIIGDCLGVLCLPKGYAIPGLGPVPDICGYAGVNTDVGLKVTGVGDAGGLSSSALSKCSSPEVVYICLGLGSESELSGGLKLQRLNSP